MLPEFTNNILILANYWKPYLKETNIMLEDATCYETSMRYPTNVKLLWESTEGSCHQLKLICKYLKIWMPLNKYEEQWNKYNNYSHKRKKMHKETLKRTKSLLYLLEKIVFVSISMSYIRPIVRGKEVKAVEFGAKVNMIQCDGINFIEHLRFNAFNV